MMRSQTASGINFDPFIGKIRPGDIDRPPDYKDEDRPYNRRSIRLQCFPLYSILMALGNPKVDYFSLDIEGAEFPVLKTIPFDKVDIRLIDIEFNHIGKVFSEKTNISNYISFILKVFEGSAEEVTTFLESKGYEFHGLVEIDALFIKKRVKKPKKK